MHWLSRIIACLFSTTVALCWLSPNQLYAATPDICDPIFGEDCHIHDGVYILKIAVNDPCYLTQKRDASPLPIKLHLRLFSGKMNRMQRACL